MGFQKGHKFYKGGEKGWFKKGQTAFNKGLPFSNEIRQKMSKSHLGKTHIVSTKTKQKISEKLKGNQNGKGNKSKTGQKNSIITRRKLSEKQKLIKNAPWRFQKGQSAWNKNKSWSEEHKIKMRETSMRLGLKPPAHKGANSHFWKGGITNDPYPEEWDEKLRENIRQRDNYICKLCGIHQDELKGWNKKLDIHHIDYNKDNFNSDNLISLCRSCHVKTNYNREYWIKFFNQ